MARRPRAGIAALLFEDSSASRTIQAGKLRP